MAGSSSEGRTSRTRSVGTKISDEEYARLEASAAASGLTVGEWCREVLLKASGQPAPLATPTEETLLSELLALRTILLSDPGGTVHQGDGPACGEDRCRGAEVRPDDSVCGSADRHDRSSLRLCGRHAESAPLPNGSQPGRHPALRPRPLSLPPQFPHLR